MLGRARERGLRVEPLGVCGGQRSSPARGPSSSCLGGPAFLSEPLLQGHPSEERASLLPGASIILPEPRHRDHGQNGTWENVGPAGAAQPTEILPPVSPASLSMS